MNENLKDESKKNINPFFEDYNTPHETVPFNLIQTQHYEEAFIEGIKLLNLRLCSSLWITRK